MNSFVRMAIGAVVVLAASTAQAQYYWGPGAYQPRASTVGESHARGLADVTRAAAQSNLLNSKAAQEYEKARSLNLDNRLKGTNYYFEMRRVNKEARAQENPRPTSEQVYRLASMKAPKRLDQQELSKKGGIQWPKVLNQEVYDKYRKALEDAFAMRADKGEASIEVYLAIQQTTKAMEAELKKHIREYPPMDYTAAKSFINRLANEARFTASPS